MSERSRKYAVKVLAVLTAVFGIFAHNALADQITLDLPRVNVTVTKDADGFAKFTGEGIQYLSQPGEPAIPYLVVKALLPPGADLSTLQVNVERAAVTSAAVQSTEAWEIRPMPVPQVNADLPALNASGENEAVYNTSIRFPYSIVGSISTGAFWEWQLADIPVALYHWNPVTKGLFTLESSQAVLTFEHKSIYGRRTAQTFSGMGKDRVKNMVVNFDQMAAEYPTAPARRSSVQEKSSYVIITTNAIRSASAQMANFVQHKENRGYAVRVFTENIWGGGTGDTASENIRNWLIANYEVMNIEYVLLIGNPNPATGDVPMKMLWPRNNATRYPEYKESPSDYYYADLTGNWDLDGDGKFGEWGNDFGPGGVDRISEIVVGRIPYYGNTADLDSILAKTVAYQNETNQEWRKKVLLPMEPSDCSTPGYQLGEAIKNDIISPKGWAFHRLYDTVYDIPDPKYDACRGMTIQPPPPGDTETFSCTENNVTTVWNNSDYGAVFWFTHGWYDSASGIMDGSHAATLDNIHPSFTFQGSCFNSHPESSNNLGSSLLKNGAIATVGATRVSWYGPEQVTYEGTNSNQGMVYEYAKRLVSKGMKCGYALHDMKQELYISNGEYAPEFWMNYTDFCLYGDPEVALIETNITDNPPTISDIPDQTTQRDIEITVPFTVSDDITPVADLVLSVTSSNTALVPNANMVFGGSGQERTLKITPAAGQTGSCTVTITAKDELNQVSTESFLFSISELAEWQWMNPLPQGNTIRDVWVYSENSVFTVGENGTIMHYDGMNWEVMDSGTSYILEGVWGFSPDNVYAAGWGGTILHYNGVTWTEMDSGTYQYLYDIWGNAPDDIYAVGSYGTIFHYDGIKWSEESSGTSEWLYGIWGVSDTDIYAVGGKSSTYNNYGTILHYDGNNWSELDLNIPQMLRKVWGSGSNNIFAAGLEGVIYHFDGSSWKSMNTGTTDWFWDIWGTSSDNVYALSLLGGIYHFNGSVWAKIWDGQDLRQIGIHGSNVNNIFAVGEGNTIVRYNGTKWEIVMPKGSSAELLDVWGFSYDNIYAVGSNSTVMHYNGNTWIPIESLSTAGSIFEGIWGASPNSIFAVSASGNIYSYNGNNWDISLADAPVWFKCIWGTSSTDVYATGSGFFDNGWGSKIYHFNGNTWSEIYSHSDYGLESIWGNSVTGMYFIGTRGSNGSVILRYKNSTWTETEIADTNLSDIWGFSENSIYAVGDRSTVLHFDGNSWSKMDIDGIIFECIWGTSENNLFAAGRPVHNGDATLKRAVFHYDGQRWTELNVDTINTINAVWGSSANNVIAVGEFGTILHYTPPAANPVLSIDKEIQSVLSSSGSAVFNISNAGTGSLTWTAEENSPWFSISPSSGSAPGTLTVTYEVNTGEERSGEILITAEGAENSPKTVKLIQARKSASHFTTIWSGKPIDSMLFMIGNAMINGVSMQPGDEIAVFDGQYCVGAIIIDGPISYLKTQFMASMDDDPLDAVINGFTPNHAITFKIWDASAGVQYDNVQAYFKDSNGNDRTPFPFAAKTECPVMLEVGNQQQAISLSTGWNIMSSYVVPENTDMMAVVQPLIDSGRLIKVIDESGNRLVWFMGEWMNNIGEFDPRQGYQIKVTSDSQLTVKGGSVLSLSNIYAPSQSDIPLAKGWNIISYPFPQPQAAMTALQPLIDSGVLEKVIDESGNRIVRFMNEWMDYIGSFEAGKGYQIKVNADVLFSIREPGLSGRSEDIPRAVPRTPAVHFTPIWTGNPFGSMIIYVTGIAGATVQPGDEIAVYDGENCVGASPVQSAISDQNRLRIACASDDDITDSIVNGFMPGNTISFRYWNSAQNREITDTAPAYISIADGQPAGVQTFTDYADCSVILTIGSGTAEPTLQDAVLALKLLTGIYFNPENTNADADGNGKVQLSDVILILQKVAGIRQ